MPGDWLGNPTWAPAERWTGGIVRASPSTLLVASGTEPAWSPLGDEIAYVGESNGAGVMRPTWRGDGFALAFWQDRDPNGPTPDIRGSKSSFARLGAYEGRAGLHLGVLWWCADPPDRHPRSPRAHPREGGHHMNGSASQLVAGRPVPGLLRARGHEARDRHGCHDAAAAEGGVLPARVAAMTLRAQDGGEKSRIAESSVTDWVGQTAVPPTPPP